MIFFIYFICFLELEESKSTTDKKIKMLREESERTLATILITNNFVNVTIIMLCNYIFARLVDFGSAVWLQFLCVTVLLTFLLLLFGEIIPKVYGRQSPLAFCRRTVGGVLFARLSRKTVPRGRRDRRGEDKGICVETGVCT